MPARRRRELFHLGYAGDLNLFTVNGMNDNLGHLSFTSASGMLLGQNQIQEATVVSDGYSGHFGDAPGSFVNYVTKSGGNDFHGNAEYFWNGSVLNATDWITKAFGNPRPFDIANQWAGSVGGPIHKNRLFFFFDAEGLRVLLPSPVQVILPSPQFEAATIANIDSRLGSTSPSDAFYRQIFNLYNATPGAASAAPGGFNLVHGPDRLHGIHRSKDCTGPTRCESSGAQSIFRKQLGSRRVNPLCLAAWIGTSGPTTVLSSSCNTTMAVNPLSSTP